MSAEPASVAGTARPGAVRVAIAETFRSRAAAAALARDPTSVLARAPEVAGGRGLHRLLSESEWGATVRVRPGHRGGLLGPLLGDRYATPARPLREHALVESLHADGLPVATPVFAVAWRAGLGWRCAVATVERENARDLARVLRDEHSGSERLRAARAVARTLRRLHDAGVTHGDLQLRNLLVEPAEGTEDLVCVAIDFDRAHRGPALTPSARMKEWMRLVRSFDRTGHGAEITPRIEATALSVYCAGDRGLRQAMRACEPRERARIRRHRLGWRVRDRLFAPRR